MSIGAPVATGLLFVLSSCVPSQGSTFPEESQTEYGQGYEQPEGQHAESGGGCSNEEIATMETYGNEMKEAYAAGDFERLGSLIQHALASVTPGCVAELQQQYASQHPGVPVASPGTPADTGGYVTDHGGGTYSTPDGFCGPSGCVAY